MAAKLLRSLADDNQDLEKQLGCMKGIFQFIDRRHTHIVGQRPKRLTSGDLHFSNATSESLRESQISKNVRDKQKREHFGFERSKSTETNGSKVSKQQSLQDLDIRDVVKGSMNREAQRLSVISKARDENILKHKDLPVDLEKSLRVLAEIRESPWYRSELKEHSRPSSLSSSYHAKDLPRVSQRSVQSESKTSLASKASPGVVAKLMGLETLPGSVSLSETNMESKKARKTDDLKPVSRFPIEPAPWIKFDRARVSEKPAARNSESSKKPVSSFRSAYSEIEKRFMDLEFNESGKDLRALKQILESMQRKGILETRKENKNPKQNDEIASDSSSFESSIVIMKPANLLEKSSTSSSSSIPLHGTNVTIKDQNPKDSKRINTFSPTRTENRSSKSAQTLVSKNKLELEKQSQLHKPLSDTNISRQAIKQQTQSRNRGQKSSNIQQNDERLSEKVVNLTKKPTSPPSEERSLLAPEYPSPVSVLDNVDYTDESPSPVKRISESRKDDNASSETFENKRNKLRNIENLVQKLRSLDSDLDDEGNKDYIAEICESSNPDHRYVAEILLASGLLLDPRVKTYQFHRTGQVINPELFLVLEQTKENTDKQKIHRKLIFDIVNEVLATKMAADTLNSQKLLRELCAEIEQLRANSDGEPRNVSWDSWLDFRAEVSNVVLDVERSIFRDLVDEIVRPNRLMQLFKK